MQGHLRVGDSGANSSSAVFPCNFLQDLRGIKRAQSVPHAFNLKLEIGFRLEGTRRLVLPRMNALVDGNAIERHDTTLSVN
jgi:hypothetical protein